METVGLQEKIRVAFPLDSPPGYACPTIRVMSPLGKLGHAIRLELPVSAVDGATKVDDRQIHDADVVLIQRTSFLDSPVSRIRGGARKIVYEIDDNLLEVPASNPSHAASLRFKDRILDALRHADAVTVSTDALRERFSGYGAPVHVLPNRIDMDIWGDGADEPAADRKKVVVGFVGTPTHQEDLRIITPAVLRILRAFGKRVVFRFFGCITDELRGLPGVEFAGSLVPDYASFARRMRRIGLDIALAPLSRNGFNECKSNIKFLEYSTCGIPGIYSRFTPYESTVADGVTGLLCGDGPGDWYEAIGSLVEDRGLRETLARQARREVVGNHCLADHAGEWEAVYRSVVGKRESACSLETARCGLPTVKVVAESGAALCLHSRYDPVAEAREQVDAFPFDGEGMIVVLGLGLGYHLDELRQRYPRADIVVVEGMREILGLCERQGRGTEPGGRIRFLVGMSPQEAIGEIAGLYLKSGLPRLAVFSLASETSALPGYYAPIREELDRNVSMRLWERLRYPKFRSDRLKIALFDFGYFLTEEISRAFEALGHAVVRVRGEKGESCSAIIGRATRAIASERPDFFLTVNHFGFDTDGIMADMLRSVEMPAAVWYVDSPDLVVRAFPKNASPLCCVFVWDRSYIESLRSLGFEHVDYLPLAADETVFHPLGLSLVEKRRIGSEVGFVGNSMVLPAKERLLKVPRELRDTVERTARLLSASRGTPFREAVEAAALDGEPAALEALTEKGKSDFEAAVLWRATLLYRLARLKALGEFRPAVRGDAGWQGLLKDKFRLGPELNYYRDLPAFYNACRVNFNATSIQMGTAVNQRVFDVPSCGAFLLTDRQASVEELFEAGEEVVTYGDPAEIPDLARFYLKSHSAREAVAAKGRARVLREHTYRHRVDVIVRRLRDLYG